MLHTIPRILMTFIMVAISSYASILTSDSVNNGWQPFSNFYGSTSSADGSGLSLQHFIEGTGAFAGHPQSPAQQLEFWGTSTGNYKPDSDGAYFTENSFPNSAQVTLLIEIAGWRDKNYLALCELAGGCQTIFFGNEEANPTNGNLTSTPLTKTLTVSGDWTLVFIPNFSTNATPTNAQLNAGFWMNGPGSGQYATFRDFVNEQYYIGIEDTLHGDDDHNDMVLRIKNTEAEDPGGEIPEPSTYALMGAGLVGLVYLRRTRQ